MAQPNRRRIQNMTARSIKPTRAEWELLARQLIEMRNALREVELALRDYQLALDSTERRTAETQASLCLEKARASAKHYQK